MKMSYMKMLGVGVLLFALGGCLSESPREQQTLQIKKEALGRVLFFDTALSRNRTQSCATCHDMTQAFSDPTNSKPNDKGFFLVNSLGDDGISRGGRNTPMVSYAMLSPVFYFDEVLKEYVGGQFWDGRAKDLSEQAKGPILSAVEMNMPSKQAVIDRLLENPFYVQEFKSIYGDAIFKDTQKAYDALAQSIAAFEQSDTFAPFDSKYDRYLRGEYELTVLEDLGRTLFFSNNNVNCATCHKLLNEDAPYEPFSNYQYHNIGIPANPDVGRKSIDEGLFENPLVQDKAQRGKFKVPSLRNVAITPPYMHNGVFRDLHTVMAFYDHYNNPDRGINPQTGKPWEVPEINATVNLKDLKAKPLSDRKIDALVAFMKLLTDRRYEYLLQ